MSNRQRTNVIIDREVLKTIDEAIQGTSYRNRSHCIEDVMRQWAKQRIEEKRRERH